MKNKKSNYRVVTFLDRAELDYLDNLAKDMYFKYGINIPRTKLIEEIIDAFKEHTQMQQDETEQDLVRRFKQEKGNK
jgi:hypothetical protein